MKKIIAILLALFILMLSGCGAAEKNTDKKTKKADTGVTAPKSKVSFKWQSNPQDYKLVAFTFDDAPACASQGDNPMTNIIKTLNEYEGAGTFFVIGGKVEDYGVDMLKYAVEQGFELGNHSTSHESFADKPRVKMQEDIETTNRKLENRVGIKPRWFRPPFLDTTQNLFMVTEELNMPVICGSRNCILQDGTVSAEHNAEHIKKVCLENVYDGQIVVMHSFNPYTAEALPEICKTLYDQGYRFVTLSQLFEYKGVTDVPANCEIYDSTCK